MEQNANNEIYKAPEAELEISINKTEFFIVSAKKLWIMNMVTMGTYGVYWNYKHWQNYKYFTHKVAPIWPVPRAIFSIFFIGSLLGLISQSYEDETSEPWNSFSSSVLYVVMIVLNIFFALFANIDDKNALIFQWLQIILVPLGMTYVMTIAQQKVNIACREPNAKSNCRISAANFIWIFLFSLYWSMVVLGSYIILNDFTGI